MPAGIKYALAETYEDVFRNHTLQRGRGALLTTSSWRSFRVSSLSAIVAYLSVPGVPRRQVSRRFG